MIWFDSRADSIVWMEEDGSGVFASQSKGALIFGCLFLLENSCYKEFRMQEIYMRRAIELAKLGEGFTNPNPLVGAVIVKDGKIIGEGYHAKYGDLHAERNAIKNLSESAEGAEIYVTLEPCCHHGKQPPCTEAIIDSGIKTVYVGSMDPNEQVAGKGVEILRQAGITVHTGVLKSECDKLNPIFFHYILNKTPYVIMKYAMTMDGKIAAYTGKSQWITGEEARNHVQHTRNRCAAIMVGVETVLADNPSLTCRLEGGSNPIRIVCDSKLRTPLDCQLVKTAREVPTYIATVEADKEVIARYEAQGLKVIVTPTYDEKVDLKWLMMKLGEMGIDSVLLEGGSTLNYSAMQAGIVNHVQVYVAPKAFGGDGRYTPIRGLGVESPDCAFMFGKPTILTFGDDVLLEYDVRSEE